MRGFATVAAFGSLGAIIFSGEAERYAQGHRPGLPLTSMPLTSMPKPDSAGLSEANPKGLDYAATGSLEPVCRREIVTLGPCGGIPSQRR